MTEITRCDCCHKELPNKVWEGRVFEVTGNSSMLDDSYDLCKTCAKQLDKLLRRFFGVLKK